MFEKVNPAHPDKLADRIASAIVDYAYTLENEPHVAVEILLGHGRGMCIIESDVKFNEHSDAVMWICKSRSHSKGLKRVKWDIVFTEQDSNLNKNQESEPRCGDNGIFKGCPVSQEQQELVELAKRFYNEYKTDGKYIFDSKTKSLTICQSNMKKPVIDLSNYNAIVNPIGYWTGGINTDSGATNRKLGSDMGDAVTGGGLWGKDCSKADVTLNIVCHILAQQLNIPVYAMCSIGDTYIKFSSDVDSPAIREILDFYEKKPYKELIDIALEYIRQHGGFEKFSEWGLIC